MTDNKDIAVAFMASEAVQMIWPALDKPQAFKQRPGSEGKGEAKYKAAFIIPADNVDLPVIQAAIKQTCKNLFGAAGVKGDLLLPLKSGDEFLADLKEGARVAPKIRQLLVGNYLLQTHTAIPPLLFFPDGSVVKTEDPLVMRGFKQKFYSGALARFEVNFKAYKGTAAMRSGVTAYLQSAFVVGGGDRLGGQDEDATRARYGLKGHVVEEDPTETNW